MTPEPSPTWDWQWHASHEGCVCGHGPYHHEGGTWPATPINGRCCEPGCDCAEFRRGTDHA